MTPAVYIHIPPSEDYANRPQNGYLTPAAGNFLNHLAKFPPGVPVKVLVEGDAMPVLGPYKAPLPRYRPADVYGAWAFSFALAAAREAGHSHIVYVETDCRFSRGGWAVEMLEEFEEWPGAVVGGSPVVWNPWSRREAVSRRIVEYAHAYQEAAGVVMAFEGHGTAGDLVMYPNGALAVYDVAEVSPWFPILNFKQGVPAQVHDAITYGPYDWRIGVRLVQKYGADVVDKLAFFACSYSGCANHHVTLEERLEMLRSGSKAAVHHIKDTEAPW